MRRFAAMGVLAFVLNGCNSTSNGGGCPPLIEYSADEQRRVAAEIRQHPNSEMARLVRDYGKMRKACRI
jgi:hypothetical protein